MRRFYKVLGVAATVLIESSNRQQSSSVFIMDKLFQGVNYVTKKSHHQSYYLQSTKVIVAYLLVGALISNGVIYFAEPIFCDIPPDVMEPRLALSVCYHSGFSALTLNNSHLVQDLCASVDNVTYYRLVGILLMALTFFNYLPIFASKKIEAGVLSKILPQGKFPYFLSENIK